MVGFSLLWRKPPHPTLTSPLRRRKPPHRTLTSPLRRRKPPHRTLTSRPTLTASLPYLPFDLVAEILCRLSVKQLLQLRCVCKSWNSLISKDSNFAKKQLRLSTSCQGRHHVFLKSDQFLHIECPISTILYSKDAIVSSYSLKDGTSIGGHVSTCDGIICYSIDDSSALLFNPSFRKFIILPRLEFPDQRYVQIIYTLVYDRFINNYKVIALNALNALGTKREVNVHILGTHCWTRIQDFPYPKLLLLGTRQGIFVSNSVNWLVSRFIVSLHLEKESYQKLSLPDPNEQLTPSGIVSLGTLRGYLSLHFSAKYSTDVWIMKEFGDEKSWTKLLTITYLNAYVRGYNAYVRCIFQVLYISEDDRVLIEVSDTLDTKHRLIVYDSINNTFQHPKFQNNIDESMVPQVYVESLISPF